MGEFNGEVSDPEVRGDKGNKSDVGEVETGSEVNETEMDEELSQELDDFCDSYMKEGGGKSFESRFNEKKEVGESEVEEADAGDGDSEADELDKEKLKEETGWSDEVVDSIHSAEEAEIYKNADLQEVEINGKKCLIRSDIDMEQEDEYGLTNRERMKDGKPPLTKNGETVELHHIGQKQDSPLAELATKEHRGKGNDAVLHDKKKETEIDRGSFTKERERHWENRAENA